MDSAIVVAVVVHAMVGKAMENSSGSSCDKEDSDERQGNKDGGGSCGFRVKRKKGRQWRKKERKRNQPGRKN